MKRKIIQSAINISSSDEKIINKMTESIGQIPGCLVADYSSDIDHNRSVISILGDEKSLSKAVFVIFEIAYETIDISHHHGEHPRIGAVDVIPFTPWGITTMEDCIVLAQSVGREIAKKYLMPVYLYGEAALIPEHENLSLIRRGGYESLLQEIHRVADRKPDYGLTRLHPTLGAVAIGARNPLVAFNVNLKSTDIKIAKEIAKKVRGEYGGLTRVKAIGVNLRSRDLVQVSMNLLNYRMSTVVQAYELVKIEARRYGVEIQGSEIIGLVPLECLVDIVGYYLSIPDLKISQVLEYHFIENID
ncbi:MAG: hypothetical protein BWY41_02192 [Candidatus Atribacteria bacterium ADurb.Bin276]|uniref:glutamate formimidoyltransferase n=1 Tax=Candidatus Atribacter allofermentans TaxID=1852833 RepID=A0A1V5SIV2_9BACT|nr:MAG: hypothetical protein BWY41_02192 [Candidatus Atribacteria bacterium ADurb.Bin276]